MPVAENNLVTLADYRAAHIIEATAQDSDYSDDELRTFIHQAASYFEGQCHQPIGTTAQVDILPVGSMGCSVDHRGVLHIFPRSGPIQSVTTIAYRVSPDDAWTMTFDATEYSVEGQKIIVPFTNPFNRQEWGEVKVTYSSGYATIPYQVKLAVILIAAHIASAGYAAIDVNDQTMRQVLPPWAWKVVEATINLYRRRW